MILERKKINIEFPFDYQLIERGGNKLAILLHGFGQTSQIMRDDFLDLIPDEYSVLIPNGPFPIPKIRAESIEHRYAWYFFDRHTNSYKIDYSFPSKLISELIQQLGYQSSEKIIVGYSQGGYLSPFLASELENISSVYGLACTIKWQLLKEEKYDFSLYQIHGQDDLMVDYKNSKEHYQSVAHKFINSDYISLESEGHRVSEAFKEALSKIIR